MRKTNQPTEESHHVDRRDFLKSTGKGVLGVAAAAASAGTILLNCQAETRTKEQRLQQIAANSYAVNRLFQRRNPSQREETIEFKKKYGEITMLDFPQFVKDTYPGVSAMDLWSSLFGDYNDDSQFLCREIRGRSRFADFDPSASSSKSYLDKLVTNMVSSGVSAKHISNNAPRNIADPDEQKRREGIRIAKIWLDACQQIGVRSMRVNTGGPRILPLSVIEGGYPQNKEIGIYLKLAIESFKEMADYGEKVDVKVTIENHWGLAADPMNVRIIINEVNSPYCEASPDFCNWEHEYMLYHGLEALISMATSMCHAKRWSRYPDVDIARCVRILNDANYRGLIALEYEAGGDPVAGTIKLMNDVVDALV